VQHVRRLKELAGLTLTQRRGMLACVVGTVCCMCVCEVANPQLCDGDWGHDAQWSAQYRDDRTMAVGIYKRKQDQVRKGLCPRIGRAVTGRLQAFVTELGPQELDECSKERAQAGDERGDPEPEDA
jgi:hypothetical protein